MQTNLWTIAACAAVLCLAILAPPAQAQVGTFGSYVKVGDSDYTAQLLKRSPIPVRALEFDLGIPGDASDNCVLLMTDSTDGGSVPSWNSGVARTVRNKDIRLTGCDGQKTGTAITDGATLEKTAGGIERLVEVRYGDANNDGKYSRGDPLYLTTLVTTGATTSPAAATLASARGLTPTTATGAWTVRLTAFGIYAAGTYVRASDTDFQSYGTIATGAGGAAPAGNGLTMGTTAGTTFPAISGPDTAFATSPRIACFALVEREGGTWYLVPTASGCSVSSAGVFSAPSFGGANTMVPANSVRLGILGVQQLQPIIAPTRIELPAAADFAAGKSLGFTAKLANEGTFAGQGLLIVRLCGDIVDVRMSPVLSTQETAAVNFKVELPEFGGECVLAVNDLEVTLDIAGLTEPTANGSTSGVSLATIQDLQRQIADLKARLDAQPAQQQSAGSVNLKASAGAPSVQLVGLLAVLGIALVAVRRRA